MIDTALDCVRRGWTIYPIPRGSKVRIHKDSETLGYTTEAEVRTWWSSYPEHNVAIHLGRSKLRVIDCDLGLKDENDAIRLIDKLQDRGFKVSYVVRTGRRGTQENPEFGIQLYFRDDQPQPKYNWQEFGCSGEVRGRGEYVMSEGCLHKSGARYEPFLGSAGLIHHYSYNVQQLTKRVDPFRPGSFGGAPDPGGEIRPGEGQHDIMFSRMAKQRAEGMEDDALREWAYEHNEEFMVPELPEDWLERALEYITTKFPVGDPGPEVILGGMKSSERVAKAEAESVEEEKRKNRHWSEMFHSITELENMPDPVFLIDGFLQEESITGLIGPARARKSIVSLNVMHSLVTGEPLFGKFEVSNKPERVVYLCPESGVKTLWKRIRNMKLAPYIGKSLFFTSMNSDKVPLTDPLILEAAKNSVVFIDTAIRFMDGDENSAQDMKRFGDQCHDMVRKADARAVVLLHHTSKNSEGLTLESGRGSGDFGGFLTAGWGTTLDDYENAYESHSLIKPVKERDFQADSFKVAPSGDPENFFLQYVEGSENSKVSVGAKAKSGRARAEAFARANPDVTGDELVEMLKKEGITYSVASCRNMLRAARGARKVKQQ